MTMNKVKYRLGLDMGTNSIGWAVIELDADDKPCGIVNMGVRIFPDGRVPGKSESSNAKTRREARGARRRLARYRKRRQNFMSLLVEYGLMPRDEGDRKALDELDPYELRANALDTKLPTHHVGRVLFHLNQHRGFKSNRKAEKRDNDTGPAKSAAEALNESISKGNARTLGEFLYERHRVNSPVRFRNLSTGNKAKYEFYPTRQMILDEFDEIWKAQEQHHADIMTNDARESLRRIISDQRRMDSPQVGKCTLDPALDSEDIEGFRCPWAHPLAQRFRIWQEVRNLEIQEPGERWRPLSKEEGDKVAHDLLRYKKVSFDKIRKLLKLPSDAYFNLESERRKDLLGDQTAAKLAHKDLYGKTWRKLPPDKRIEIVELLLDEEDAGAAVEWLTEHTGLEPDAAERVASAFLPDGHCRFGLRAIRKILRYLEQGMNYPKAEEAAGYDHARAPTGELSPTGRLPYYGEWLKDRLNGTGDPRDPNEKRYGRFPNPTVHIGLGQLRRVVNALISKYGRPHQVVIEMTRNLKLSKRQRDALVKEQTANQRKNDARDAELKELGLRPNYENRLKMRLWEELNPNNALDRRCPFTGEVICLRKLFSDQVEFEHLIPFSLSWDDSPANKVVSLTRANREKGNRTPHGAFGETPEWDEILRRSRNLPRNKQWRFAPDALQRSKKQGGFLARQLNETGWLSRLTKEYMSAVVSPNNIQVTPGRLTSMIRYKWGLDSLTSDQHVGGTKDRTDHRHHAIDAVVVALTDRSLLHRMSSAYDEQRSRVKVPLPWANFRKDVKRHFNRIVVSHKPDHGSPGVKGKTTGQLHNATIYGLVELVEDGVSKVVHRKKISDFERRSDLDSVRDCTLRKALRKLWDDTAAELDIDRSIKSSKLATAFANKATIKGALLNNRIVRRVRVVENRHVIPIRGKKNSDGKPHYISTDANQFADIWRMGNGSWKIVAVPTFYANRSNFDIERFRPLYRGKSDLSAEPIMRLHKNDMGVLGQGENLQVVRIVQVTADRVTVISHTDATRDTRTYRSNSLRRRGFRKVRVDEIGRMFYRMPFPK